MIYCSERAPNLLHRCVALLYRIIDCLGTVTDLTHFFIVLVADFLLNSFELGDVGVVTLLH